MSQQIENRIPDNSSATAKIPPAQRANKFKDLPKDAQEKLLRLQNTDGDFLKISSGETERRIALLILAAIAAVGLAAIIADSSLDLKRIIVFFADALLLSVWLVYLIIGIYNAFKYPLKNRVYLTPTLVIETLDGTVRYRQLKDAGEIVVNKFATDIGRRNKLDIKFEDGDTYQFYIPGTANSKQSLLMQNWQEKAANWKLEAISALKRGDTNYLKAHDVFSNLAETNAPILLRQSRIRKENLLLLMTVVIIALNGAFIFLTAK